MARDLTTIPDITPPDSDYPNGRIRNDDQPTTDGTPVIEELYGDLIQFFHKLMRLAGISHNNLPENETNGFEFITALQIWIRTLSASTTQKGVVELATNTETQAGIDSQRAITPAGLSSRTATETRTGIAELATVTEVITGTDNNRIVTPSGLSGRTATETRTGIAELATVDETRFGIDQERIVTPYTLDRKIHSGIHYVGDVPSGGYSATIIHNMGLIPGNYVVQLTSYTPNAQPGDNDLLAPRTTDKSTNSFDIHIREIVGEVQDLRIDWTVIPISP